MERIRAATLWVFDLDGTLTQPVHDFASIRRELGIPGEADILEYLSTLPEDEASSRHAKLDRIERELSALTKPAPGATGLMEQLAGRGCHMGILTRNSREIALLTLEQLGIRAHFNEEAIIGRDEAAPKPDPHGIHKLAGYWHASPRATVMVGDYLFDLQAGRAAGTSTVHVDRNGNFRWPELADLSITSLEELLAILK